MQKIPRKYIFLSLILSISLLLTIIPPVYAQSTTTQITGDMVVNFIDVGQADSIFVQLPNKETMLIDAGNNNDSKTIVNFLKLKNVSKIDYLVATHLHEDHIGAMDDIINTFEIKSIYMPKVTTTSKTFEDLLLAIKDRKLKVNTSKSGVKLFDFNNLSAIIIAPVQDKYDELNNYSTVIKLSYGETSFLLAGDSETVSELEIINSGVNIQSDVLKIGHHGSDSSTSDKFLTAINPKYAVISVGKDNSYGHPNQDVLDKLISNKVTLYRTDIQGNIAF